MTFFGKVTVLKSLALSQIMYTAAVLYTPEWVIKQIRKLSMDFLWNNKKNKIKDTYLQRDYKNGGIKFIDIKAQIMSLKFNGLGESWMKLMPAGNIFQNHNLIELVDYLYV